MKQNRLLLYLIVSLFSTIHADPKNKTFQNIFVNESTNTRYLYVEEGARIGDGLLVKGNATITGNLDVSGLINGGNISGTGGVQGPVTSTVNAVARWANTTGDEIKDSTVLVDDLGNVELQGITKNGNTVSWPTMVGAAGTFLGSDGLNNLIYATPAGSGNVSTTFDFANNNALIRVDLASGVDNIKESNVILDNANNMTGLNSVTATTFNGNLNGNATTATSTTTFTGSLAGDVTGTQSATVVSSIGNGAVSAAQVISATNAANAATPTNTPNTIVSRDGSGDFIAGTIQADLTGDVTGNLFGNATTATSATNAVNFSGSLMGDVSGTQNATVVNTVGGQTAASVASGTVLANAATSSATNGAIVRRDGSGAFTATTINATTFNGALNGNATSATTATTATTATNATNFTGALAGDVTGNQTTTVVNFVGNGLVSAADIDQSVQDTTNATSNNTANTLVKRDALGNFTTNMISITGAVLNPNDTATKDYVDSAVATGFIAKEPAIVVSTTDVPLSGLQTIDGVTLIDGDRILLVAQTDPIENGLWVAHAGAWTRPADFANGTIAGSAFVLITSGTINAGSGWSCTTPTAVIGTDPISFVQIALPGQTTAANVGTGAGQIFRDKTGQTLNFKTIAAGPHMVVTNNTNDITLSTDATSANTAGTIVARDGLGDFSANQITATAGLIGAASLNVLKAGDTMTGNLNMAAQTEIRLQDASGGEYVGLFAPATVPSSYSVSLPSSAPIVGQFLQATSASATQWATVGGSPSVSKIYYVALNGSDSNDGSFSAPFLTVSHAVSVANGVASLSNPIAISIGAGLFIEDNTGGPITVTADGISLLGTSIGSTFIIPMSSTNNLFNITTPNVEFANFTVQNPAPGSTASAINLAVTAAGTARFTSIGIGQFQTGISTSSTSIDSFFLITNIQAAGNDTGISITNMQGVIENCLMQGPLTTGPASNTCISIIGTDSQVAIFSSALKLFETGITISGGAGMRVLSTDIELTTNSLVCLGASISSITGCSFIFNNPASINVTASGAGTEVIMEACNFACKDTSGNPQGTAIKVVSGAQLALDSCAINHAALGIQCGQVGDTSTTALRASGAILQDCTMDIIQNGTSTLNFFSGVVDEDKISINDPTNVSIAAFNSQAELVIGTGADVSHTVYEILNGQSNGPELIYQPNYYGFQGTTYANSNPDATFNGTQSQSNDAAYYVVTGSRTNNASLNLISDTGNFGVSDFVRGWNINKSATAANLTFNYSNNDTSGQAARGSNTVMQLNGFDNQVEFPLATTAPLPTNTVAKLVWAGDTNLYRSSAGVLRTDGNLIVGALTANRAVITNASNQLASSAVTDTELGYLSGVTSPIETQLDNKVNRSGDTMTGTLTLPAGTAAVPSLQFTGSTNTGISVPSANILSFSTSGVNRMSINGTGVTISNLTPAGVVHNNASGLLSSSLIINADVSASAAIAYSKLNLSNSIVNADINTAAAIADTKLATISTAGKVANSATTATTASTPNTIVLRDGSGNITGNITGSSSLNVLKAGDTMTGTLVHPAGSAAAPSIQFTGSTNTGISAATANTLSFDTNGVERMRISTTAINTVLPLILGNITCNQAIQAVAPANGATVNINSTTSILLLTNTTNVNITVVMPAGPTNGQLLTIALGTVNTVNLSYNGNGASMVGTIAALNAGAFAAGTGGSSVTYIYYSTNNTWYRFGRG